MKYQLATTLLNLDGSPIKSPSGEVVTCKTVCVACLVQAGDKATEDKVAAFKLAVKLETAQNEVDLTAEEVTRLKRLVGESMPVVIVGRVHEILEQAQ